MFEFKGLIASSNINKNNENQGLFTPRGKNIVSRKNAFSEKAKGALSDVKNTAFNTLTPFKKAVPIEKRNAVDVLRLSTPKVFKSTNNDWSKSKLTKSNVTSRSTSRAPREPVNYFGDSVDEWNANLILSDDKIKMLFVEANHNLAPPTPPAYPTHEPSHFYFDEISPRSLETSDYGSEMGTNGESDELPPLNFSTDDLWDDLEKDAKCGNKVVNYF